MNRTIVNVFAALCLMQCSLADYAQDFFRFGTSANPNGNELLVDSKGLVMNDCHLLPVMGEIHFSRVPADDWKRELQKMKSGGITIVSTYVFWNHHEKDKDIWDWSGNNDLRRFVETCKVVGLPLILRIGPFCHGEVYQGGMPDYVVDESIQKGFRLRSAAPEWLAATRKLYENIFAQIEGLQWKDGGPIIGIQLENESRGPWAYYDALKRMAQEIGFDTPLYTRTGWPQLNGREVFGELLPLYGDYADGFWDRALTDMPGDYRKAFIMRDTRSVATIATETFGRDDLQGTNPMNGSGQLQYPYFTCELGGGMMPSYHRRINIFDRDAYALAVCKLGSGSNLPGYYMYHGGTNPSDERHPMSEMQDSHVTNYNDMPHLSYDFYAPLGEMGQPNESFFTLHILHQMLADWGSELSQLDARIVNDTLAYRGDFKFVNSYVRMIRPDGNTYVINDKVHAMPFCKINGKELYVRVPGIKPSKGIKTISEARARRLFKISGNLYKAHHKGGIMYNVGGKIFEEWWTTKQNRKVVAYSKIKDCGGLRQVKMGSQKAAEQPLEFDWEKAAVWKINIGGKKVGEKSAEGAEHFLLIKYKGDCARVYADGQLVADNFWNGRGMLVRCSDVVGKDVELKILPLGKDYPIYLQDAERQQLDAATDYLLSLDGIDLVKKHVKQWPAKMY